jgi:type II secretory ATPase GspE/PulE/Tfp pilus assembly ATPase PilB-like protein
LCEDCKQPYTATPEEVRLIKHIMKTHPHPVPVPEQITLYRPVGCSVCGNSGFRGRSGIFEGIVMDEAVEEVVIRDPREHIIAEAARPQGIPTMVEDGIEKVLQGITSIKELERVIELPNPLIKDTATAIKPIDNSTTDGEDEFLSHVV